MTLSIPIWHEFRFAHTRASLNKESVRQRPADPADSFVDLKIYEVLELKTDD